MWKLAILQAEDLFSIQATPKLLLQIVYLKIVRAIFWDDHYFLTTRLKIHFLSTIMAKMVLLI